MMKLKLKLLLFSMMFIGLGLSFCSAGTIEDLINSDYIIKTGSISIDSDFDTCSSNPSQVAYNNYLLFDYNDLNLGVGTYCIRFSSISYSNLNYLSFGFSNNNFNPMMNYCSTNWPSNNYSVYSDQTNKWICIYGNKPKLSLRGYANGNPSSWSFSADYEIMKFDSLLNYTIPSGSSSILVSYNNDQSFETITCDGDQAITINGLSTFNSNTFTPIYKVYYNSGVSITSNTTSNTYLDGIYLYTLSGSDNLFTPVIDCSEPESQFSGYLPTFEITGGIENVTESGNIFNNFAENSVKFTLSNIPSYIQYVIIIMLLLFIIGFIRKFKRR